MRQRWRLLCGLPVLGLAACGTTLFDDNDIYSAGAPYVLCAANIDDSYQVSTEQITDAVARASADGTTLHLYAHSPGETIRLSTIEDLLATATAHGLAFATYAQLGAGTTRKSVALSFDDHGVAAWTSLRPLLARYGARVTFFVSLYLGLTADELAQLRQLSDDGHDIEYHSTGHLNAVAYTAAHGIDGYVADEIVPALGAMRADGYPTTVFAYPFGARDGETDAALSPYFAHLRAIRSTCPR
jgi:hypothetical protein